MTGSPPNEVGVLRKFRYGRSPRVHIGKNIVGRDDGVRVHVRTWCGLSGSPSNRQFLMTETDEFVTCLACLKNHGAAK